MTDSARAARVIHGWEHGFSPGPRLVLSALAGGYRGLLGAREWLYGHGVLRSQTLPCPVVSIGNLTVGGTGKTPAVELAVQTLAGLGRRVAIVSRGYRRRTRGIEIVADAASIRLDPADAGDEPFLLARRLPGVPVVVGANRYDAARLAVERFGTTAIVLDDAFQHRTLAKNVEVVMTRARKPWGNGQLLPHGPLREPLSALSRADLIVASGAERLEDAEEITAAARRYAPGVPVATARYVPVECWEARSLQPRPPEDLAGLRLVAFAGLASPDGFARTLEALGVDVAHFATFVDHHWYSAAELAALDARAAALGAEGLVTTEKDWVRIRDVARPRRPIHVVSVRLELLTGAAEWQRVFERACRTR
jgi:tetraacyldisaccharide 4'-kinase